MKLKLCPDSIIKSITILFTVQYFPTGHLAPGVRSGMNMAHQATPSSQKALMMELKSLQEQPVEGFRITLVEESDLYNWEVAIFGPPNTLYEGGYFKVGKTVFFNSKRKWNSEFRTEFLNT